MTKSHVVVHCSATADGLVPNWGAIRKYHTTDPYHMWRDVGYNFGIERIGDYVEVLMGRHPDDRGAHCPQLDMNEKSIGICMIGNFDVTPPDVQRWEKLKQLIFWIMNRYNIPVSNILGHREVQEMAGIEFKNRKTCPGTRFDMALLRKELSEMTAIKSATTYAY